MENFIEYIKQRCKDLDDIYMRELHINGTKVFIAFCEGLVDTEIVSNFVIRSIVETLVFEEGKNENVSIQEDSLKDKIEKRLGKSSNIDLESYIAIEKIKKINVDEENIFKYIMSGYVLIILREKTYVVEAKAKLSRGISEPSNETSIRGAKDSFVESIQTNLGLIRKRIKTENLVYKESELGTKTKTKVGVIYISNIAKIELVEYILEKLSKIDTHAILDINYIQEFIEQNNDSDFPVSINTERPDIVSYYLLEGRIAILIDNSPYVLVLPAFFEDFINNIDDMYQKAKNVTITKIIRYICLVLTITVPAFYLSLITFDQETIPTKLLNSFASQVTSIPFPAFFEAIIMIFAFEVLRESDLRSNKISGNTLSIVGALILGEAAVSAGIVSPIMIIVVALTMICGLAFSDINVVNALRKWRIIYVILASICGIVGIGIATIFFVVSLSSTSSYTKSFTYPVAPFNFTKIKKSLFTRESVLKDKKREKILTNNLTKTRSSL